MPSTWEVLYKKMNLYQLHTKPEELDFHDEAHEKVPFLVWQKYRDNPVELKKREDTIAKDAYYSYLYAADILNAPFPKGEEAISKDAAYSYYYANYVGPFSKD